MSVAIEISMRSTFPALVEKANTLLAPERVHLEIATECAKTTRNHFRLLDATRANRMGGKRTHFYGSYVKGVTPRASEAAAIVGIADPQSSSPDKSPLAAHFFGAYIEPVKAKALTIPACPDAYGTRARESVWAGKLHFALLGGTPALIERSSGKRRKGEKQWGRVVFWLVQHVQLKPDKTVIPSNDALLESAHRATSNLVNRLGGNKA